MSRLAFASRFHLAPRQLRLQRFRGHRRACIAFSASFLLAAIAPAALAAPPPAPSPRTARFQAQLRALMRLPLYRHAEFGVALYSLTRRRMLFTWNGQKLFTPASTTKLVTEGCALRLFGPGFRFHTRFYRAGPLRHGVLHGDLVMVAGGDPNLSARLQPGGRLSFENWDHSYDGSRYTRAVPGNPLRVLLLIARRLYARGLRRVTGGIYVDAGLFPEGSRELGTGVVISPIVVNDNLVDLTIAPGAAAGSRPQVQFSRDTAAPDGTHTVVLSGSFPAGSPPILYAYAVPQPSRFAQYAFVAALRRAGIQASVPAGDRLSPAALAAESLPRRLLADYVSPPFAAEVRVTLKVSQNLHASMVPYLEGALLAHRRKNIGRAGFALERNVLLAAGLDLTGASQSDGAGGAPAAFFTPDFMARYLAWTARQPYFPWFYRALPVMGRDGTLFNIQTHSPAAGHVRAKTGTFDAYDALNRNLMVTGKGMAGYMTTAAGERLCFAFYANRVSLPLGGLSQIERTVGNALGELAGAAYALPPPRRHAGP